MRADPKPSTGLAAYTQQRFINLTYDYYMKHRHPDQLRHRRSALGFIVGTAIAGQTFYNFTLDNLRHFGALKAMGASNGMLLRMILLQALLVGVDRLRPGRRHGVASSASCRRKSELAFRLPWWLLLASAPARCC